MMYRNELVIKRPNGEIETVVKESDRDLAWIVSAVRHATREAGRGEVLSVDGYKTNRPIAQARVGCPQYRRNDGCPLHGEGCAEGRN